VIAYLDTHAFVRLALGRSRLLGREASRLIQRAELLISPMVLVELEYLYEIGRLKVRSRDLRTRAEHELGLKLCELPFATVASAAIDETWTSDVFDRIIVANARVNGLAPLISADENIAQHYPRAVW
jgi:PIN domain nuclease of toxin-antitoxin system